MFEENHETDLKQKEPLPNKKDKKSKVKGILTPIISGVMGSVLTLAVVVPLNLFTDNQAASDRQNSEKTEQVATTSTSTNAQQASTGSIADIVEKTSEAIVGITNIQSNSQYSFPGFPDQSQQGKSNNEEETGTGSGVIYKKTDDAIYVVTNNHVIEDASKIEVTLSNKKVVAAELVGTDSLTDIAVLKVKGKYNITPITFGDSDSLRAGDEVIAIGNPLGLDLYGTVTQGIVSAVNRSIEVDTSAGTWEMNVIQTDAAINPGNSGGALINTAGQLVGINSMKISEDEVEGLGFAIPSNDVKEIIGQLTKNGQVVRPYLGISVADFTDIPQFYLQNIAGNISEGVIVTNVDQTSPAAKAGLKQYDIIVSINGEKITDSAKLRKYLYTKLSVGDKVTIKYYRNGKLQKTTATLKSSQQQN